MSATAKKPTTRRRAPRKVEGAVTAHPVKPEPEVVPENVLADQPPLAVVPADQVEGIFLQIVKGEGGACRVSFIECVGDVRPTEILSILHMGIVAHRQKTGLG